MGPLARFSRRRPLRPAGPHISGDSSSDAPGLPPVVVAIGSIPRERSPVISFSFEVGARLLGRSEYRGRFDLQGPASTSPPRQRAPSLASALLAGPRPSGTSLLHTDPGSRQLSPVAEDFLFRPHARASPTKIASGFSTSSSGIPIWPQSGPWNRATSIHRPRPGITQALLTLSRLFESTLGLSLSSPVSGVTAVPAGNAKACRLRTGHGRGRVLIRSDPRTIQTTDRSFLDIWKHRTTCFRSILNPYGRGRRSAWWVRH